MRYGMIIVTYKDGIDEEEEQEAISNFYAENSKSIISGMAYYATEKKEVKDKVVEYCEG